MKVRFFFLLISVAFLLNACRQPIPGHAILQLTLPQSGQVTLNMGMDSYLLLWHQNRQFIIRTEKVHGQSLDLHVVETFFEIDSAAQATHIVKVNSDMMHLRPAEQVSVNQLHPEITLSLSDIIEHRTDLTNTCHDNSSCCLSGCDYQLCCSTTAGKCLNESCTCLNGDSCEMSRPNLSIHDFAKLFSREKLKVTIPFVK
jgi:hypothetical protein